MRPDYQHIGDTLAQAIENFTDTKRLEAGLEFRKQMHAALQAGQKPDHYRYEWLVQSAARIIETLQSIAQDFDNAHPSDKCSVYDFMDMMATVNNRLNQALKW